jgi:hypothetical protein
MGRRRERITIKSTRRSAAVLTIASLGWPSMTIPSQSAGGQWPTPVHRLTQDSTRFLNFSRAVSSTGDGASAQWQTVNFAS